MGKLHKDSGFFSSKLFAKKKRRERLEQVTPEEHFKMEFMEGLKNFKEDADALSRGQLSLSNGWKDLAGYGVVSSVFTTGGATIGILAAVGVIGGAASGGIGLAIALVGIGVEIGYIVYRSKKKDKEYKRVSELLDSRDLDGDVEQLASLLASIYQQQLKECSYKHAEYLAESILKGLQYAMMKNKNFRYDDLFNRASLQAILLKNKNHVPNDKSKVSHVKKCKRSARRSVYKPALYCDENDHFYTCKKSNPGKYGVLYFKTKQELNDFRTYVHRLKDSKAKWSYKRMISTEESALRSTLSMFNKPVNDEKWMESEESGFVPDFPSLEKSGGLSSSS